MELLMSLLCFSLSVAIPNGFGTSPLTPSARISALNIVGDLLRKVGVSIQLFSTRCFHCRWGSVELPLSCGGVIWGWEAPHALMSRDQTWDNPSPGRKAVLEAPGHRGCLCNALHCCCLQCSTSSSVLCPWLLFLCFFLHLVFCGIVCGLGHCQPLFIWDWLLLGCLNFSASFLALNLILVTCLLKYDTGCLSVFKIYVFYNFMCMS